MKRFLYLILAVFMLAGCAGVQDKPIDTLKTASVKEYGEFHWVCKDACGNVKWEDTTHNALANEGQYAFLDVFLRAGTAPTGFYLGLCNSTPTATTTLSTLTGEASGNNYSRQAITRDNTGWPTLALDSGNEMATSKVSTFTASGGAIGPVTYAFLATTSDNTGKLVSYTALSATRTLQSGDTLSVTYKIKLQ